MGNLISNGYEEKELNAPMEQYAIAVDLDGTLAEYNGWKGHSHIGAPVMTMINKVKKANAEGKQIWIFTARLADESQKMQEEIMLVIEKWCHVQGIVISGVTCIKHKFFKEFWDDRAKGVSPNTGLFETEVDFYANDIGVKKEKPLQTHDILLEMAKTFEERNAVYGDNFKTVGKVLEIMFPNGVELKTADDYNRWHLFELMVVKFTRFTNSGLTHQDSIHDTAIYAAMVESLTNSNSRKIGNK